MPHYKHPLERLMTVRQRTLALKTSYEPAVTLGLFAALGYLPKAVQDQLFNLLLSRATAVMTNVPGPAEPLTVAGSVLRQSLFWVPQTGDVGMGCRFSPTPARCSSASSPTPR